VNVAVGMPFVVTNKLLGLHRNSIETDEQIVKIKRRLVGFRS
jgi:hypothetical protein